MSAKKATTKDRIPYRWSALVAEAGLKFGLTPELSAQEVSTLENEFELVAKSWSEQRISTGITPVDNAMDGGLYGKKLVLLVGPAQIGKSMFAARIALLAAVGRAGRRIVVFNTHTSRFVYARELARLEAHRKLTKKSTDPIAVPSPSEFVAAAMEFHKKPLPIHNDHNEKLTIDMVESKVTSMKGDPHTPELVIVQSIDDLAENSRNGDKPVKFREIIERLKKLASDMNIPVLALCHPSKCCRIESDTAEEGISVQKTEDHSISPEEERGALEFGADVTMFLQRKAVAEKKWAYQINIHHASMGPRQEIKLHFLEGVGAFIAKDELTAPPNTSRDPS